MAQKREHEIFPGNAIEDVDGEIYTVQSVHPELVTNKGYVRVSGPRGGGKVEVSRIIPTGPGKFRILRVEELDPVETVEHPAHYGGKDDPYEVIKVIDAWGLGFKLGNVVKYIARAGKKDSTKELEDLHKARFYINHRITELEEK